VAALTLQRVGMLTLRWSGTGRDSWDADKQACRHAGMQGQAASFRICCADAAAGRGGSASAGWELEGDVLADVAATAEELHDDAAAAGMQGV
jgi:hypothetical protein